MAIDAAMLEVARADGISLLRLYRWRVDTLSLGANESARRTWNRVALERDGVPTVRRPSGGRGVWHAASDLTYAWVGPSDGPAGARERYRDLHRRLAGTVASFGLEAELATVAERSPGLVGGCFDAPIGGEVLVAGRKTIGSAQKVVGTTLLQHGAIALDDATIAARYRLDRRPAARTSQHGGLPEAADLAQRIIGEWLAAGAVPAGAELTSRILSTSVQHVDRFRDLDWTWRR